MSEVKVEGYKVTGFALFQHQHGTYFISFFQTSEILAALAAVFEGYNDEEKAAQLKKVRPALRRSPYPLPPPPSSSHFSRLVAHTKKIPF